MIAEYQHSNISAFEDQVRIAQRSLVHVLEATWAVGSEVKCLLSRRQRVPSRAVVFSHSGDGTLRVKLFTVNRRGHRTCKNVHWSRIVG